jgi:hypothetical protein
MVNRLEKLAGVYESTAAAYEVGYLMPGNRPTPGRLWAANVPDLGETAVFELPNGTIAWHLTKSNVMFVEKVASGLQIMLELVYMDDRGFTQMVTLIAPRGRLKKIFEFIGHPL